MEVYPKSKVSQEREAVVGYYDRAPHVKAIQVLAALQDQASNIQHEIPKGATYETIKTVENNFGAQHLATVYRSQLQTRTQRVGESLQEFATATETVNPWCLSCITQEPRS
jgi:hypothetical protein